MRTGTIYQKTNWLCGTQLTGVLVYTFYFIVFPYEKNNKQNLKKNLNKIQENLKILKKPKKEKRIKAKTENTANRFSLPFKYERFSRA